MFGVLRIRLRQVHIIVYILYHLPVDKVPVTAEGHKEREVADGIYAPGHSVRMYVYLMKGIFGKQLLSRARDIQAVIYIIFRLLLAQAVQVVSGGHPLSEM